MRTITTTLLGAFVISLAAGCATRQAPAQLVDARAAYQNAASGPAGQFAPAQLHDAKVALDKAESTFLDEGDKPVTQDFSYIATRKAQIADATGQLVIANQQKETADAAAAQITNERLKSTQGALANSQQNLAKTQDQLDAEKRARADADQKAAKALADLQKIASVKQETRGMVITLSGSVLFKTDESTLLPTANTKLNDVADALIKGNPDSTITIEGHTDSQGTHDHNMVLSNARAESVKTQLVSRGVAADRIKTVGLGPDRPVADNKTAEGRANNRRVEIIVEPSAPKPTTMPPN